MAETVDAAPLADTEDAGRAWFDNDVLSCHRKIFAIAPTFEIFDEAGSPLVFCQEKLFRIKDDIRVYADSSKTVELLRIRQRNVLDWVGVFDVIDPASGERIGVLRRRGWRSWVRDEWQINDGEEREVGRILETGNALLRRILRFLPYSFEFVVDEQTLGTFTQHFSFFGYEATMDISAWRDTPCDRRLAFAGALLLMAVESKEDQDRS